MNRKKRNARILITILILAITLVIPVVQADSYFDSNYDSSLNSNKSSSGSSSSSFDRDNSISSSNDISETSTSNKHTTIKDYMKDFTYLFQGGFLQIVLVFITLAIGLFILAFPFIALIVIISTIKSISIFKPGKLKKLNHSKELAVEKIKEYLPTYNKNNFLSARYQDFVDIQNAWMNFDYKKLRTKVTDELYNQYKMQLQVLKMKNRQNIMTDFKYIDSMITKIKEENNQISVTIELQTSFYDYIVKGGKVIKGNKYRKLSLHYKLVYVCNKKRTNICPNCGAKLTNQASQICPYCSTTIASISKDWVLSKKKKKDQR